MNCRDFSKVIIGCDHAGFKMKEEIKINLSQKNFIIEDVEPVFKNPLCFVNSAFNVCKKVLEQKESLGILVCGTGIGMSIAANRFKGIRAALLYDDFTAEYSRRHNHANVLVFGSRTMNISDVLRRIEIFLSNQYEGGKYEDRNKKIDEKTYQ